MSKKQTPKAPKTFVLRYVGGRQQAHLYIDGTNILVDGATPLEVSRTIGEALLAGPHFEPEDDATTAWWNHQTETKETTE